MVYVDDGADEDWVEDDASDDDDDVMAVPDSKSCKSGNSHSDAGPPEGGTPNPEKRSVSRL